MPERGDEIAPTADVLRASLSLYDQPSPVHEPAPMAPRFYPTGKLRWLDAASPAAFQRLQQEWAEAVGMRYEWRDVPVVNEAPSAEEASKR
jgi:hypothetical protein